MPADKPQTTTIIYRRTELSAREIEVDSLQRNPRTPQLEEGNSQAFNGVLRGFQVTGGSEGDEKQSDEEEENTDRWVGVRLIFQLSPSRSKLSGTEGVLVKFEVSNCCLLRFNLFRE